mgnify:CR=1 FL=1
MNHNIKNRFEDNRYIYIYQKKSRRGYTTGSCAAAASKAAAIMLFSKEKLKTVELMTPKGFLLTLDVLDIEITDKYVSCAIKKDSGDDPDVTNGILVYSKVSYASKDGIDITGGVGIGIVTKPGLQCKVGEYAINKVPRKMIYNEVSTVLKDNEYVKGIKVEISVPEGVEIANKTFNPRLGIEGGISILGTSGIVEPMSEKALVDTIRVQMNQLYCEGYDTILITPGNYGEKFSKDNFQVDITKSVKCSNFIGKTIDIAVELQIKRILFISHIGKFVKAAGGIMNTHSQNADSRMEIIAANAIVAGADIDTLKNVMKSVTTDDALKHLKEKGFMEETMKIITDKVHFYLNNRAKGNVEIEAIIFSNVYGILGKTKNADAFMEKLKKKGI